MSHSHRALTFSSLGTYVQDMWTNPIVTLGGRAPRAMHRRLSQRSQDSSLTEAQSSSSRKGGDADAEGDEIEMQVYYGRHSKILYLTASKCIRMI